MARRWYYAKENKRYGPVPDEQLVRLLRQGQLRPGDMILGEGNNQWVPLFSVFPDEPNRSAPPPPPVPAALPDAPALPALLDRPSPQPGFLKKMGLGFQFFLSSLIGTWVYSATFLRYVFLKRGLRRREKKMVAAKASFGEKVLASGLSSESMYHRIDRLDRQIDDYEKTEVPIDEAKRQQDALYASLADQYLHHSDLPKTIQVEQGRARDAVTAFEEQRVSYGRVRKTMKVRNGYSVGQLVLGYSITLLALGLLIFFLLPHGDPTHAGEDPNLLAGKKNKDKGAPDETGPAGDKKKETVEKIVPGPIKDKEPEKKKDPRAKNLKELFAELSPGVPSVECFEGGAGSGFLIERGDKLYVATNRHVIERSYSGVEVHFFPDPKRDDRLIIPRDRAKVVAIHREVDLALIDVSADAVKIKERGIKPVVMAPQDSPPVVGEDLFVIGHPSSPLGALGTGFLERTLTKGIVSGVGRKDKSFKGSFTQTDAAINPGNSGGPVFNMEGKVIAVATFVVRMGTDKRSLESLNFCLEVPHLHELLDKTESSLSVAEIDTLLAPKKIAPLSKELAERLDEKSKKYQAEGYKFITGSRDTSTVRFRLGPKANFRQGFDLVKGEQAAVFLVSQGSKDILMTIFNESGVSVVRDDRIGPEPHIFYSVPATGDYFAVVQNITESPADCLLVIMVK